jgi:hypothetical protein
VELSTISNDGLERVNINKLKVHHHNNIPTNFIIIVITIDIRYYNIVESRHTKKPKPNYMPWLHPKRRNLPWSNPKPRKISDEDDKKWIKEEDSRNFLQKTFNNNKTRNFN